MLANLLSSYITETDDVMGFFGTLFSAPLRTERLDADPHQRELADSLISAVEGGIFQQMALKMTIEKHYWSRSEAELRIAHALRMVKAMRPDIYKEAKEIALKYGP